MYQYTYTCINMCIHAKIWYVYVESYTSRAVKQNNFIAMFPFNTPLSWQDSHARQNHLGRRSGQMFLRRANPQGKVKKFCNAHVNLGAPLTICTLQLQGIIVIYGVVESLVWVG